MRDWKLHKQLAANNAYPNRAVSNARNNSSLMVIYKGCVSVSDFFNTSLHLTTVKILITARKYSVVEDIQIMIYNYTCVVITNGNSGSTLEQTAKTNLTSLY